MPKRFFFVGVVCVLVGFAVFLFLGTPRHRITEENIDKIKVGMTSQEVEDILGCPAGNYTNKSVFEGWSPRWTAWIGENVLVDVEFKGNPPRVANKDKLFVVQGLGIRRKSLFEHWFR